MVLLWASILQEITCREGCYIKQLTCECGRLELIMTGLRMKL